jgi:hypothetical protein
VVEPLDLERVEEALGERVVETVARAAHAAADAVAIEELVVVGAGVLRSAIAVVDEPGHWSTLGEGDSQGFRGDCVLGSVRGRPADDATREDIDDRGEAAV